MTAVLIIVVIALAIALAVLGKLYAGLRSRPATRPAPRPGGGRVLFPFVAHSLSPRALDAALRLARAEDATLVPVFLARVSLYLPLEAALPRQSKIAIPLQEAIEQRAAAFGVPVDARIERGRSYRHALRQMFAHESFDRVVIAAGSKAQPGFDSDDVAWLIDEAPGEIVVFRPDPDRQVEVMARRPRSRRRSRELARAA